MAGRIARLQNGDFLGFGLQNGVVWFGGAHPEQWKADAEHKGTDKQAAAQWAQPWKFWSVVMVSTRASSMRRISKVVSGILSDVLLALTLIISMPPIGLL